jgi:hypothetical protein
MYIESVKNRNSPPAILLRESYRQNGKVRKRTLCNLSDWPVAHIEGLRGVLRGGKVIPAEQEALAITRSLPYGHVAAALGTVRDIGLDRIIGPDANRFRDLVIALVVSRVLEPASKLLAPSVTRLPADLRSPAEPVSSLDEALGLNAVGDDERHAALDWLLGRQAVIETALARRHLTNATLMFYDVTSNVQQDTGRPVARFDYSRSGGQAASPVTFGLLCAANGYPVAVEVFDRNTAGDPAILAAQIEKLMQRFRLDHVAVVGDRHLINRPRLNDDIRADGLDWITALGGPAIKELLDSGALRLSMFDQSDRATATSVDFPGQRVVVCRNARLAVERARQREDLLTATERDLAHIAGAVARERAPLRGIAEIALAVGAVIDTHKMRKHFDLVITDATFSFTRKLAGIAVEAAADGIFAVRTSLPEAAVDDAAIMRAYESLGVVQWVFRGAPFASEPVGPGTADPHAGPGDRVPTDQVRAHAVLCKLAYCLEWHMRQRLAPMLLDETLGFQHHPSDANVVVPELLTDAPAEDARQAAAIEAPTTFHSLLANFATLARNTIAIATTPGYPLIVLTKPTPLQQRAFDLLGVGVEPTTRTETP